MTRKRRLGEILLEGKLVTESQLSAALQSQKTWGGKLGSTLVRMGFVKEEDLLRCLSAQLRLPAVDFGKVRISASALQLVPHRIAEKYNVIPVALKEEMGKKTVILAMSDPTNLDSISEIQFQTGVNIRPVVATESSIGRAVDQYYAQQRAPSPYGFEKKVELSSVTGEEGMVILSQGDEKRFAGRDAPAPESAAREETENRELLRALIRALVARGVVSRKDIEDALGRAL